MKNPSVLALYLKLGIWIIMVWVRLGTMYTCINDPCNRLIALYMSNY